MKKNILILFSIMIFITGCENKEPEEAPSLTTKGELIIGADESLRPFIDVEIAMFSVYYPESVITPLFLPEKQVVEKLLANEVQTGIICRNLIREETDIVETNYSHKVTSCKIGYEKIVIVVNRDNPLKSISYTDLTGILSGKISDWSQLNQAFTTGSPVITVIPGGSNIDRHFFSSEKAPSPAHIYALDTTIDVFDYVRENKSAMGIAGGSWLYTMDKKPSDIKILACTEDNRKTEHQLSDLLLEVYAVTHEPFTGLGNGFISFLVSQKGQLILSKSGMLPYKPIEREIHISDSL